MSGKQAGANAKGARRSPTGGDASVAHHHRRLPSWPRPPRPSAAMSTRPPSGAATRGERTTVSADPRTLRPDGRDMGELRPVSFVRDFTEFANGIGAGVDGQDHGAVHGVGGGPRPAAGCAAAERGGSPPSTRCCPGLRRSGSGREAAKGKQSGRTHEIQRLIGRSLRAVTDLVGHGRAAGDRGLRRAAGRRGDAHRVDLRRLRGPARLLHPARAEAHGVVASTDRRLCGGVGGCRRRCLSVGPGLLRGLARRGGHEHRHDRIGALHRGAGDRRGHGVQPRRARRAGGPGRPRASACSSTSSAPSSAKRRRLGESGDQRRRLSRRGARRLRRPAAAWSSPPPTPTRPPRSWPSWRSRPGDRRSSSCPGRRRWPRSTRRGRPSRRTPG